MSKLSEFDSILAEFEKEIARTRSVNGLTDELLANEKAQVAKLQEVIQQLQTSREAFDRTTEALRRYIEEERNRPRPEAPRADVSRPDAAGSPDRRPAIPDYFSTIQLEAPPANVATNALTDDRVSEMLDAGFQVLADQQKLARQHLEQLHENTLRQLLEQAQQLQQQAPTSTGGLVELLQTRLDDQRTVVKQAVDTSMKGLQDEVAIQVEEIRLMLIEQNRRDVLRFFGLLAGILALAGVVAFFIFMQMK